VIDRLDGRRAQVFVESLIVEVNADKAAQFGIQLQSLLGNRGASTLGALGTNFGNAGTNVLTLQTGAASGNVSLGQGFNLGVASRQSNGAYVLNALANFLETNGAGNILSTPNLLTLDNEEARIIIGNNVPFVTGSYANSVSDRAAVGARGVEGQAELADLHLRAVHERCGAVDALAVELVHDVLDAHAAQAHAGAHGIDAALVGPDRHLTPVPRFAGDRLDLHDHASFHEQIEAIADIDPRVAVGDGHSDLPFDPQTPPAKLSARQAS